MLKRLIICLLVSCCLLPVLFLKDASAATIQDRSVTVSTATVSATTSEDFKFTLPTVNTLGSITFEYCSNTPLFALACTAPAGMDVSAASLNSQTGNSGFSIDTSDSTANRLIITRAASNSAAIPNEYVFGNIKNPSTAGQTVYIRISSQAS